MPLDTAGAAARGREVSTDTWPGMEPGLGPALAALSPRQRQAVVLTVGFGLSHQEAADLL